MMPRMTETWKPVAVPEFEDLYEVSDRGRVRSLPRRTRSGVRGGKILKPQEEVMLCGHGLQLKVLTHRLVKATFEGAELRPGRRGQSQPGNRNGKAVLTTEQVLEMRELYARGGMSQRALAARYGIRQSAVSRIVTGKRWGHLATDRRP